ncbi:MAG: radical SAM protein [Anaerolineales bacterium]|nr:radical SAM protein [Anaerolineales bacterium]
MQYVFGPVPSRRLGQSLGIDTIPLKTCNWNCVYCQLGRTKPLCNQRKDYIPIHEILAQIKTALKRHTAGEIDWITFVGSGEPTLHAGIGYLIKEVRSLTNIPVAVITNGSLLFLKSVRDALRQADAVLPGLDAGTPELYKKLNRPHPDITFDRYIGGLVEFRQEYRGKLWVEVMLVKDLNDTAKALERIACQIEKIRPDKIHIGLPTRPPAEKWVFPPTEEGVLRAIEILGNVAEVASPLEGKFDIREADNIVDAILAIIIRHPMSEEQLLESLADFPEEKQAEILENLQASPHAQVIQRYGRRFWCGDLAFFPDSKNH